ncbi:MAG: hypothetical protein BGP14_16480 [Sphingobacteriales bacterium 44-15]|nr:MAG: hypothetical protein BGP14_16480 [Sphingobacteriales bacterium 44-15]
MTGIVSASATGQTTYVDNGTSTTYTLQTGDSLYIKQGTFTGNINDWNNGGKVTVAGGATFKPSGVNGYRSKYVIYGTAILPSLQTEKGFSLQNYGVITVNGGTQMNGSAQNWYNYAGGTITFNSSVALNVNGGNISNDGDIIINGEFNINSSSTVTNTRNLTISSNFNSNGGTITNYSDIAVTGDFKFNSNSTIINKKSLTIGGSFSSSNGTVTNEGMFYAKKTITFGGGTVTNTCRLVADEGITINNSSTKVYNNGILWATSSKNASSFTNSGTIYSSDNGVIKTGSFTNYGKITGNGFMYITGKSTLGSSASVGQSGTTTDVLKIYTVNRTNTSQVFDDQWGTVYANAKYTVIAAPDTVGTSNYSCSVQYVQYVILPVTWDDFTVTVSAGIPVVNWSVRFDEGTTFLVQRSFNGKDFSAVANIPADINQTNYRFNDNTVGSDVSGTIYYRICAAEPDGQLKYSEIRTITLNSTVSLATLRGLPNPFTGNFTLEYQSAQKGTVTVRVFDVNGQVKLMKQFVVSSGKNAMLVSGTSGWKSGIYMVQVLAENGGIAAGKIIKQ